jgi:hypothetical protein
MVGDVVRFAVLVLCHGRSGSTLLEEALSLTYGTSVEPFNLISQFATISS